LKRDPISAGGPTGPGRCPAIVGQVAASAAAAGGSTAAGGLQGGKSSEDLWYSCFGEGRSWQIWVNLVAIDMFFGIVLICLEYVNQ
jgi:hypothetical protein